MGGNLACSGDFQILNNISLTLSCVSTNCLCSAQESQKHSAMTKGQHQHDMNIVQSVKKHDDATEQGAKVVKKPFQFPCTPKVIAKQQRQATNWTVSSYFEARHKKLVAQAPCPVTTLFHRIHIYCTSVRSHSQRALESIVWRNGGTVHKNFLRTVVTHVIADNLCASKIDKELSLTSSTNNTQQVIVVRPQWILQSLQRKKLLPTWDFQLVKAPPNIKTLDHFFQSQSKNLNKPSL